MGIQYVPFAIIVVMVLIYLWTARRRSHLEWKDILWRLVWRRSEKGDGSNDADSFDDQVNPFLSAPAVATFGGGTSPTNFNYREVLRALRHTARTEGDVARLMRDRSTKTDHFRQLLSDFTNLEEEQESQLTRVFYSTHQAPDTEAYSEVLRALAQNEDPNEVIYQGLGFLERLNTERSDYYANLTSWLTDAPQSEEGNILKALIEQQSLLSQKLKELKESAAKTPDNS